MIKLKQRDLPKYRKDQAEKQFQKCPLCSRKLKDAVLDHCHTSGHVRMVLCRLCNSLEGKIENWIKRYGRGVDRRKFLLNLVDYWAPSWHCNPIHPKHRTPEEKEITKLKKRLRDAKRSSTKDRIKARIAELQ